MRRSFVLSLGLSLCLAFVGCKSDPEPAPAAATPAAACPKCGPDKACTCPPAEGGAAPAPAPAAGG